jgi:cell wall-associated NlpC family hydrolase
MGSSEGKSFDCSGFVMHVFSCFGVQLPHGSGAQATVCEEIKRSRVQPGDLLFFSGRKVSKSHIGHVAIVKSVEGGRIIMIHATVHAGVIEEVLEESEYFTRRFIKAGRLRKAKVESCEGSD